MCVFVFPVLACQDPLGMENHERTDDEITASDWKSEKYPYNARLNNEAGWLVYNDFSKAHFLQVKLGSGTFTLTGVATQGIYGYLVKTFTLSYSTDGIDWVEHRENGQVKVCRFKVLMKLSLGLCSLACEIFYIIVSLSPVRSLGKGRHVVCL